MDDRWTGPMASIASVVHTGISTSGVWFASSLRRIFAQTIQIDQHPIKEYSWLVGDAWHDRRNR